ncbi:type VII secretion system ESX-3 AAA family ATPase EccA3 [Mycobacterium avium subsp. avium]|uniref:type VII secretion system ESX-3 AAA family ATPase EccA3 n=1 Tax=Mycobacterium avium TaxID=1764 RepID=UPI0001B5A24D|nr:type VII secretion system ESX-3 AAA family ATPase EccA3 [Mycobacterium avium]ETB17762.1 secretion protein EccA [Mycobacterium avium subsp. avium 11-4751]ANR91251.1 type VII secretion AAA-ATPase EccA [Mycobacterium avium]QGW34459.1 Type VII secretion system protein EccA1 [Mycobacterium avium subsp. avium]UEA20034.1 type VII secretion system ESX-3 AAA family ATPase EccA3 [Mycobacterium avium subsp. avium]UEA33923.1 type VII secretion system ESX-3 AAA family ATPase EccA3 [Mycobacterium avium s
MERGDTGMLTAQPVNSRVDARVDGDVVSRFATCCRALGIVVYQRQRPADLAAARSGFAALTRIAHDQCDAWTGLAAAGDVSLRVLEAVARTAATAGVLQRQVDLAPGALGFRYDTGLYLQFRATTTDDFQLAYAGALATAGRFADADRIVAALTAARPGWREARWVSVVINYRAERWSDVVKLLTPIVNDTDLDDAYAHAAKIALGTALARLGMFAPALSYLEEPDGPVAVAAVDGALAKALVLRAHVDEESASEVLQDLYAAHPENEQVEQALSDTSFGIVTTTAARIEARTDPWDPATEPSAEDFVDPAAHERKAVLLAEAERQLAEFIGLDEVKNQVSRLKSSVAMELVRKQRGLAVAQRAHHLVFAGPPGTGKTTIARVVAKIYCGLGLLKRENIREVHRADLIGQHIGETEAKTNAIIDSALDGVLFLDEAYALVATGAKNDFGLVAIDTLLARMENDRDRLVVIIAGYRADLDKFLDTNEGLRSRFTRNIDFPSYAPSELVEIATKMAEQRDSVFEQAALDHMEELFTKLARESTPDANGISRRNLDIAGNGRFVRNIVERAEEEREFRLDHSEHAGTGEFTDEELMTITDDDVARSVEPLLRGLGLSVPA